MRNRYYLMRHGESEANLADIIISDPATGCVAYGLTSLGREQARDSALASGLDSHTLIICSDFLRTRQTAQVVQETLACEEPILDKGLRERGFGRLEGKGGPGYRDVWNQDNLDSSQSVHGAETPLDLAARLTKAMDRFEQRYDGKTILLISHGDSLRYLQLAMAKRALTEHLKIKLFGKAEIRRLEDLPDAD